MYLSHYNLVEKPFQITVDPKFLWLGEKHREALSVLKYGVLDNKGFLLLTGDVGTGKTTVINSLLRDLDKDVLAATVLDPRLETMEFFNLLAGAFGIEDRFTQKVDFLATFETFLNEAHKNEKRVLLIIDEAQRLNPELLEEIRLLSNMERADSKLLNMFFVGQDEFKKTLLADDCRALRQRIAVTYQLNPLTEKETSDYILYRLKVAGTRREIFDKKAVRQVYAFSRGYPRLINIICDQALLTGFVRDLKKIKSEVVRECAQELAIHTSKPVREVQHLPHAPEAPSGKWLRIGLYVSLALAVGFCGYLFMVLGYNQTVENVRQYYREMLRGGEVHVSPRIPASQGQSPVTAVPGNHESQNGGGAGAQ